jgi:hypothetical protein
MTLPAAVRCGDLLHHAQPVQQVGKAVCLEQHRPIAYPAILFHGADPVFMQLVQCFQPGLGLFQLHLGISDQKAVSSDLIFRIGDLLVEQKDLLIDILFLLHHGCQFCAVGAVLLLQLLKLGIQILAFLLQLLQLRLQLAGTGFRRSIGTAKQQAHRQKHQCRRPQKTTLYHIKHSGTSGWRSSCRRYRQTYRQRQR